MTTESRRTRTRMKPKMPLSSFGPEWRELWLKASKQLVEISFNTKRDLYAFRLRATQYRRRCQEESVEGWQQLYFAESHIPDDPNGCYRIIFRPKEGRFAAAFTQANIASTETAAPFVLGDDPLASLIATQGGKVSQ